MYLNNILLVYKKLIGTIMDDDGDRRERLQNFHFSVNFFSPFTTKPRNDFSSFQKNISINCCNYNLTYSLRMDPVNKSQIKK